MELNQKLENAREQAIQLEMENQRIKNEARLAQLESIVVHHNEF